MLFVTFLNTIGEDKNYCFIATGTIKMSLSYLPVIFSDLHQKKLFR